MINIKSIDGLNSATYVRRWLNETFKGALWATPARFSSILKSMTVQHWNNKYPGSQHFNESKINELPGKCSNTSATGEISIDAAGINRAYRDVIISSRGRNSLTIPLHREAYGKKPEDIPGLFGVKNKDALFVKKGQGLVAMYALVNRVVQKRDESMMPSDSSFSNALGKRFIDDVESWMDKTAK